MANVLVEESCLSDIASAIRTQNGLSTLYKPSEMMSGINSLEASEAWGIIKGSFTSIIAGSTVYSYDKTVNLRPGVFMSDINGPNKILTYDLKSVSAFSSVYMTTTAGNAINSVLFGGQFLGARLEKVILPNNNMLYLPAYVFNNCSYLSSVEFCSSTEIMAIGSYAFAGCLSLSTIDNFNFSSGVNFGDGCFCKCGIESLSINTNGDIGQSAFYSCSKLSIANISCRLISSYAFYNCGSLTTLSLNITSGINALAFDGCNFSGEIIISGIISKGCQSNAFANKTTATNTFWLNVTECSGSIGTWGGNKCIAISAAKATSVTWIGKSDLLWASLNSATFANFNNCSNLVSVYLPNLISYGTFSGCYNLSDIYIPKYSNIASYAFANCSALTAMDLSEATTLGNYTFDNCRNLTSINLLKAHTFSTGIFRSCYNLSTLSLPSASVFNANVFSYCSKLMSLYLMGSSVCKLSTTAAGTFSGCPIYNSTVNNGWGSIYVPSSLYATYKASTNWVAISDRFVSM